jgi:uncharacterized protein YjiS (DUF1127 family)
MHTHTYLHGAGVRRPTTPLSSYLRLIRASMRRVLAQWRRYRRASQAAAELRELDPSALRDLGFDPSEISSVAAEMAGVAEPSRERVIRSIRRGA